MASAPDLMSILPYLIAPGVLCVLLLVWARRRGATWTQVQVSFAAAMLGAFLAAAGWVFATYLSGESIATWQIVGSELLVAVTCGVMAFFGMMPQKQDLTPDGEGAGERPEP